MIENMTKKTKIVLSCVGIAAVVVPVALLLLMSASTKHIPDVSQGKRPIDTKSLQDTAKRTLPAGVILPSPSPSPTPSPSASPATSSAR